MDNQLLLLPPEATSNKSGAWEYGQYYQHCTVSQLPQLLQASPLQPKSNIGKKMNSHTKPTCKLPIMKKFLGEKNNPFKLRMTVFVSKTTSFQFLQLHLLPMLDTAKNPMRSSSIHTQELLMLLMCIIWMQKIIKTLVHS